MTGYFTVNDNLTETSKRIKGDGSTVLNVYYDRATITINFWTDSNKDTRWNGGNVSYVLAENGDYYYYDQPYPSGYYFIGTGPNASYQPTAGDTVYYPGYMSSASMPSTTYYSASTSMYSHTISSSYTYVGITSGDDYWFIREYDSGYYYYPLFYSYSPAYSTGYYAVGTGPNPTAPGTHNQTGFTNPMVGLYQHPLPNWPVTPGVSGYYWKYYDPEDTSSTTHIFGITVRDAYSIPDNFYTTTWDIYAEATSHSSFKTIHWMIEKLDGTFEEKTTSQWGNNTSKQYYDHKKFYGFNAYGHNLSSNSTTSSFVRFDPDVHCAEWSDIPSSSSNVYFYFIRRTYSFIYMSNNEPVETKTNVKYGANISSFANKTLEDHDGYYFDGWYADPGFKTRYDFNTTMPDNNVVVFAKWVPMRFRVVLDPTGGDSTADVHFGSSQQATAFRLDYGELIGSSGLNAITREGYTLLGWYYDQAGQHPFSFETGITDTIRNMDMTYGDDLTSSRRQGVDIYNNNAEWYDNDGLHDDVRGYLKLYALWSKNAVGGSGVRVRYDAIQGEGHFGVDPNTYIIRDDPNIYADQAKAYAQAASTPDDAENRQFLYWVVMRPDEDGNLVPTNIKVYPGQTFTVDMAYAVETEACICNWSWHGGTDKTSTTVGSVPSHYAPASYVEGDYYYTFDHWAPTPTAAVSGEVYNFEAVYTSEHIQNVQVTATWMNGETQLGTTQYTPGATPSYNGTPTKPETAYYTYTFDGWTIGEGTTVYAPNALPAITDDTTYYAHFTQTAKVYTITFNANGGTFTGGGSTITTNNVPSGTAFGDVEGFHNIPTRSGYTFVGWYESASSMIEVTDVTAVTGNKTVYAHWEQDATEKWYPVSSIKAGEDYLIGIQVGSTVYLMVNYNVNASNPYYYDASSGSSTYYFGYLATAGLNGNNVVSVSGAATDFQYVTWQFSTTTGGTITSTQDGSYKLYWDHSGVYPNTTGDTWVWNSSNGRLSTTYNSTTYYLTTAATNGTYYARITSSTPSYTVKLYSRTPEVSWSQVTGSSGSYVDFQNGCYYRFTYTSNYTSYSISNTTGTTITRAATDASDSKQWWLSLP